MEMKTEIHKNYKNNTSDEYKYLCMKDEFEI